MPTFTLPNPVRSVPVRPEPVRIFHLPGKHDQKTHGKGGPAAAISQADRDLINEGTTPNERAAIKRLVETGGVPKDFRDRVDAGHRDALTKLAGRASHREEVKARLNGELKEVLKDSNVYIRMSGKHLESVLENGVVNQFASKHSHGAFNPPWRSLLENLTMGEPNDSTPDSHPIYGYLTLNKSGRDDADQYGGVALRLKEKVKERTTFLYGDSLDDTIIQEGVRGRPDSAWADRRPSRITDPSIHSFPVPDITFSNEVTASNFTARARSAIENHNYTYAETQIRGGVYAKDIDAVILTEKALASNVVPAALRQKIRDAGIKVITEEDADWGR